MQNRVVVRAAWQNGFVLFEPGNDAARGWLVQHSPGRWWGESLCVPAESQEKLSRALARSGFQIVRV